jgi:hypothetical protein
VASNQDNDPKEGEPAVFRSPGFVQTSESVVFPPSCEFSNIRRPGPAFGQHGATEAKRPGRCHKSEVNKTHALCPFFPMKRQVRDCGGFRSGSVPIRFASSPPFHEDIQ